MSSIAPVSATFECLQVQSTCSCRSRCGKRKRKYTSVEPCRAEQFAAETRDASELVFKGSRQAGHETRRREARSLSVSRRCRQAHAAPCARRNRQFAVHIKRDDAEMTYTLVRTHQPTGTVRRSGREYARRAAPAMCGALHTYAYRSRLCALDGR